MTNQKQKVPAALDEALEGIYESLKNDNADIDLHIDRLKAALGGPGTVTVDPARLAQNNRQGRKMMQAYFKRRGVNILFS